MAVPGDKVELSFTTNEAKWSVFIAQWALRENKTRNARLVTAIHQKLDAARLADTDPARVVLELDEARWLGHVAHWALSDGRTKVPHLAAAIAQKVDNAIFGSPGPEDGDDWSVFDEDEDW